MKVFFIIYIVLFSLFISAISHAQVQSLQGNWDDRFCPCGTDWSILTLQRQGDTLYAGGNMESFGRRTEGKVINQPIVWDGIKWSSLGNGVTQGRGDPSAFIQKIINTQSNVYIIGTFDRANDIPIYDIARWNKSKQQWYPLGNGVHPNTDSSYTAVEDIVIDSSDLLIFGDFHLEGKDHCCLARWMSDRDSLIPIAYTSFYQYQKYIIRAQDRVIVAGYFDHVDTIQIQAVAAWNLSLNKWEKFDTTGRYIFFGTDNEIGSCIKGGGDTIFFSGNFDLRDIIADSVVGYHLVFWDGHQFQNLDKRLSISSKSWNGFFSYEHGVLYMSGAFSISNDVDTIKNFAHWDGHKWVQDLSPKYYNVSSPYYSESPIFALNGTIFSFANQSMIARWNGTDLIPVDSGYCHGFNRHVRSICADQDTLYVAGDFLFAGGVPAEHLARWYNGEWHPFNNTFVYDYWSTPNDLGILSVQGNKVYFWGNYVMLQGNDTLVNGAAFDGTSWQNPFPGAQFGGTIKAILPFRDELIIAGNFQTIGKDTFNCIARWDGKSFHHLGVGIDPGFNNNQVINCLYVKDDILYVGGTFQSAGGKSSYNVSSWDGTSWSPLASQTTHGVGDTNSMNSVYSIGSYHDTLCLAGDFCIIGDTMYANGFALYDGQQFRTLLLFGTDCSQTKYIDNIMPSNAGVFLSGFNYTNDAPLPQNPVFLDNEAFYSLHNGFTSYDQGPLVYGSVSRNESEIVFIGEMTSVDELPSSYLAMWHTSKLHTHIQNEKRSLFVISPSLSCCELKISLTVDLPAEIKISDALGQTLVTLSTLQKELTVNVKDFCNGIYFCTITSGGLSSTEKFIVEH
jgi:hypothetical protein